MNIAIVINAEKKGFLCSLGDLLESNYGFNITYIARDNNVEKIIKDNLGDCKKIIRLDERKISSKVSSENIIKEFPDPDLPRRNNGYAIDILANTDPFVSNGIKINLSKLLYI